MPPDTEKIASHCSPLDHDLVAALRLESDRLAVGLRPASSILKAEDIAAIGIRADAGKDAFDLLDLVLASAEHVAERRNVEAEEAAPGRAHLLPVEGDDVAA